MSKDLKKRKMLYHSSQRSACITGASSGLGFELVKAIAPHISQLYITGRDQNRLEEVKKEIQNSGSLDIQSFCYDFSDPLDASGLLPLFDRALPDILINNAGAGFYGLFSQESFIEQQKIMTVNYSRTVEITYEWLKRIDPTQKKQYFLCFISSMASFVPTPGMATYGASKAAITSFASALKTECNYMGLPVSILTVCPGQFRTGFRSVASHRNLKDIDGLHARTSLQAQNLAYKIVRKIFLNKEGTYVPFPWSIERFLLNFILKEFIKKKILENTCGE